MSMRPSGKSSATIATTLDVPMSRATMRFLFSLAMSDSLACRSPGLAPCRLRNAYRKTVGVAQVDIVGTIRGLPESLRVYGDEPRQTAVDTVLVRVVPESHGESMESLTCHDSRELSRTCWGSSASGANKPRKARYRCVTSPSLPAGPEKTGSVASLCPRKSS